MKLFVDVSIYCGDQGGHHATMRKEFDIDAVPVAGMYLEDPTWKEEKEIGCVIFNPEEGYYCMVLKEENDQLVRRPDRAGCEELEKAYRFHGWKSASEC